MKQTRLQRGLLGWYRRHGRASLPWRTVRNPYHTLVSEFMLQQTQVDRVTPQFRSFVEQFPDFHALARASTADVLRAWKGLGYNSRAIRLKRVAEAVVEKHGGTLPSEVAALRDLPGVGPYTAAAIRAFAFGLDDLPVDTNVRRIAERVGQPLDPPPGMGHDWGSALMDLGSAICTARKPKCLLCPLHSDCAGAASSEAPAKRKTAVRFVNTTRYARGRVIDALRALPPGKRIALLDLHRELELHLPGRSPGDVAGFVASLERDGLVACDGDLIALPD